MPSAYLQPSEVATYGAPAGTSTNEISQASALLDAYLRRPEGLVWTADAQGLPCYMAALTPTFSFTLEGSIAPGAGIAVQLNGPVAALNVGDVLVLDRANPELAEACVVATTVGGAGQVQLTLQNVVNAHAAEATADYGLVIEEQRYVPDSRPLTFAARTPLIRIHSGVGRYGYGRRGDGANYNMEQFNLLAAVSKFGGPPVWELWQSPLTNTWDITSGQIWVPAGIMLAYYSQVKVRYIAGFAAANLPAMVKLACARIIAALTSQPGAGGNVKSYKAGDTAVSYFIASVLDADMKASLRPFMARAYV